MPPLRGLGIRVVGLRALQIGRPYGATPHSAPVDHNVTPLRGTPHSAPVDHNVTPPQGYTGTAPVDHNVMPPQGYTGHRRSITTSRHPAVVRPAVVRPADVLVCRRSAVPPSTQARRADISVAPAPPPHPSISSPGGAAWRALTTPPRGHAGCRMTDAAPTGLGVRVVGPRALQRGRPYGATLHSGGRSQRYADLPTFRCADVQAFGRSDVDPGP
jgi:hypothetical protein